MADLMQVSDKGILEIWEHEGFVPAPYFDSVRVLTVYVGHTAAAGGLDPADIPLAMPNDIDAAIDRGIAQFKIDIAGYAARVRAAIKVPLRQHEFDALSSFDLNTGGINRAQLTKSINAKDPDAARHFMGWLKPPELRKRRTAEQNLFKTGNYDANGDQITIWRTDGRGNLAGVLRTISGRELLQRFKAAPVPAVLPKIIDVAPATLALRRAQVLADQLIEAHAEIDNEIDKLKTA